MPITKSTHDMEYFYKYMSSSTAEIVLKNRTLRWSSPSEFNDPFDVPRELAFNLSPSEIMHALIERHIDLIKNPPEDISGLDPRFQSIVNAAKENNSANLTEELTIGLRKLMEEEPSSSYSLTEFKSHWRNNIKEMRILCLSESHKKTSMWYHYADKYKGAVIQFSCNDSADSPWRIAKPIDYTNDEPLVSTADGLATLLMMPKDEALASLFDVCMYTKSEDWEYEKEWRMGSFKRPSDTGAYTDYVFDEGSIGNLYLGPLIDPDDRANLVEASKAYSNMHVYDSHIGASRKLSFTAISG